MDLYCYLNGEILPESEAKIGVKDIALLRGFGAYEGITAFKGEPFRLGDHYKRLEKSATFLGLKLPVTEPQLLGIIKTLWAKHDFPRANFRVILTGGETRHGIEPSPDQLTFYILTEKFVPIDQTLYESGAKVITREYERPFPEYKTTNYIAAVRWQLARQQAGALEIVYLNNGKLLEASTSNVFIVKDGKLITPDQGILFGITRQVVLELARAQGIACETRPVTKAEFLAADEVLITSSYKDVVPVVKIDETVVGDGQVGAVSRQLVKGFQALVN